MQSALQSPRPGSLRQRCVQTSVTVRVICCPLCRGYGKTSSTREGGRHVQKEAATRCVARMDSGRTKGDEAKQRTWCLHFARGACTRGYECMFLHRLPTGVVGAVCKL